MATSRMVGQVGRVVGGRYRLLAPIGTGASADVFVADDVSLRRRVAVKVLHAALAGDESFLRRFRAEARTVAALRHPNIMAVYDWGEEDDGPYLVLEYLGGGSLRDLLDRGHRLSPSQALLVGLEAARALDYAHRRGLVHRDVKPANLLFDDEGRLCVADFGIARALAEATWTEPSGAVVGTVRYASPEQARGSSIDGKADVYALALVLIEAVTGRVPFSADTTIATLMGRLDGPIPIPDELGPLGPALAGAGALNPPDRVDAAGLVGSLDAAARLLPRPAPLPLAPADTIDLALPPSDPTQLAAARPAPAHPPVTPNSLASTALFDALADPELAGDFRPAASAPDVAAVKAHRRWPRRLLIGLVAALALAGAIVAAVRAATPTYAVPAVTSLQPGPLPHHFHVTFHHVRRDGTSAGQVVGQSPRAGTHRPSGSTITVDVSDGATLVAVPDLTHLTLDAARSRLAAVGLIVGNIDTPYRDDVPQGEVISWSGNGALLPKGSTVDLVVSNGPRPVQIPDLRGRTYADAKAILDGLGLPSTEVAVYDDTIPNGSVVNTNPGAGPVAPGTSVTVNVSQGPQIVTVPDVSGASISQATQALAAVGLKVGAIYGPPKATHVFGSLPAAGSHVPHGSSVDLYTR